MQSKANTLRILSKKKKSLKITIPNFVFFSKKNFKKYPKKIIFKILKKFKSKPIILRSSAKDEDLKYSTNAGKYDSIKLTLYNSKSLALSINKILKKFKNNNDEFIVQELFTDVEISGVVFTRNLNNGSPYYIVNYDRSGLTDIITSGKDDKSIKSLIVYKNKIKETKGFYSLLSRIKKIEKYLKNDFLDIEFAIKNKKIIIFQCRSMVQKSFDKSFRKNDERIDASLTNIKKKFSKLKKSIPNLSGKKTIFSNMIDWNPAEMIGSKPSALSSSLYCELITDKVWAEQRANYGYKDVRPNPLLVNLAGSPYIDARVDFNSFMPAGLDKKIETKIINHLLKKLISKPSIHDKVEFDLVETCYDIDSKINVSKYLNKTETKTYLSLLKKITNNIVCNNKIINQEKNKLKILDREFEKIIKTDLSPIQKIYFLINNCKKNGTLPFAGLARCAFVATKILKSLTKKNILTSKEIQEFYSSTPSITTEIRKTLVSCKKRKNMSNFFKKYGHIRPLSYSINSKNYKENFKNYFSKFNYVEKINKKKFTISKNKKKKIDQIFEKSGMKFNTNMFLTFARKVIYLREFAKLKFTKSIDEIFFNIRNLGKEMNLPSEMLEKISIKDLLYFYNNLDSEKLKKVLKQKCYFNKNEHKITDLIEFPNIIIKEKDFYLFERGSFEGNFITDKSTTGEIIVVTNKMKKTDLINNKIVVIENADPGFDYIFSYKIKGLITKFGGANSHMSIRCMELNIPAIIGLGRFDYEKIVNSKNVFFNSKEKIIKAIN